MNSDLDVRQFEVVVTLLPSGIFCVEAFVPNALVLERKR